MGILDEGHFNVELEENEVKLGDCVGLGLEKEPDTLAIEDAVKVAIEDAVKVILRGLGEDINREGVKKTPLRVAKAFQEGTRGYRQKVNDIVQDALFPESVLDGGVGHTGVGGLVIVRDLNLFSYCESCLIPFQVKCHVGYIPSGQRVVGLSKLSRVADVFAKRLQIPQRLADEVCLALQHGIKPSGVAVILHCSHIHFPNFESAFFDSNRQGWIKSLVISGSGVFESETADIWSDFLSLLRRGVTVEDIYPRVPIDQSWCPFHSVLKMGSASSGMNTAVASILQCLDEDPLRKELVETPARFVRWLMNFKCSSSEIKLNGVLRGMTGPLMSNGNINHTAEYTHNELSISFWSLCEHHLLPFHGVVHLGYFCNEGVNTLGKSILQSIVHFHCFKLQVQERLTRQIADTISSLLSRDVIVVVEAYHTCMISRGIEKYGSNTATIAVLGRFSTDPTARAKFLQNIPNFTTSG